MIGVVVWSNSVREQAVIWCDDHAALAFLGSSGDLAEDTDWPEPGTILELETETVDGVRYARNVRPVANTPCSALPKLLQRERGPHLALIYDSDAEPIQIQHCASA